MLHPPMLNWLRRWLNVPARVTKLDAAQEARLAKLELERPAFIAELEAMLETCQEVLDRAESKRGRLAAKESRQRKEAEPEEPAFDPNDREAVKTNVRRLLVAQGKLRA